MNFYSGKVFLFLIYLFPSEYQFILGQNRIIGGEETEIAKFPYMLQLTVGRKSANAQTICGAVIIGNEWAVSAANCFENKEIDYNNINVIAGSTDLHKLEGTASKHKVIQVVKHELFQGVSSKNDVTADIAVLKVSPSFTYNQAIQPIKLPGQGQPLKTNSGTVSGWGRTSPHGPFATKLRYVNVPQIDTKTCKARYEKYRINLRKGEICYGVNEGRKNVKDKCMGDSGGPLVNTDKVLLGLVSWGISCGTQGFPGVYTDAAYFRDWIRTKTGI